MQNAGLTLNPTSASFSWNYAANHQNAFRDVLCKNNVGKYAVKFSKIEAICYWQNYPAAGLAIQNQGIPLDEHSSEFSWNYVANNDGIERSIVCDKMKKTASGQKVNDTVKVNANGVPERGCTSKKDGRNGEVITCNWDQMATPTCPVPGPNVAMPDNCRP